MIIAIRKYLTEDSRGITLVELIIAMTIAIITLAGTIKIFTKQQSVLIDENDTTKVRAKGRHAMTILAREVRMAGYGLPPLQFITGYKGPADATWTAVDPTDATAALPATAKAIRFRLNLDNVRTTMNPATTVATNATTIPVINSAGFNNGDNIVIYNPNGGERDYATVSGTTGTSISFSPQTSNEYSFGEFAKIVTINKWVEFAIELDDANRRITRTGPGGTVILVDNVNLAASQGLVFEFLDATGAQAATLGAVDRISIVLNMIDPKNADATIELKSEVQIRNS